MSVLRLTRDVALSLAGLAVFVGVVIYFATRPTDVVAVEGRDLFVRYCASCHIAAIDGRRPVRAHGESAMPVWGQVFEREMEERKIGWPQATTIQRERLIAEYVLTLQP